LLALFFVPSVVEGASQDAVVAWIKQTAHPFDTCEPREDSRDLAFLEDLVGGAHIVALGEATHGTSEFFKVRHRIMRYLATHMGFTVFAIEAGMPEVHQLNSYVLTGRGDPRTLLNGLSFWPWETQEVLDMIHWMRAFNSSGAGRVQFAGFDMTNPSFAAAIARHALADVDPAGADSLDALLAQMRASLSTRSLASVRVEATERLLNRIEGEREALAKATTPASADWAIQNMRIVEQFAHWAPGPVRDSCMAANVDWILDHEEPGTRIVVCAHNLHVNRTEGRMGSYLAKRHGPDMVVLGFATYNGRYNVEHGADGPMPQDLEAPSAEALEAECHATGLTRFVLDLRNAPGDSAAKRYFAAPKLMRVTGILPKQDQFSTADVARDFDAIVFISHTSPSELLHLR
jgi:erythromycin esterase